MDEDRKLNRKFYLEFIAIYKSLPALWNTKSPLYHDRRVREEQYEVLLKKFRQEYPEAGRALLGRRINILRSNWRKEYRRIEKLRAAALAENANIKIEAELWYFEALSFIIENDDKRPPIPFTQTLQSKRKLREDLCKEQNAKKAAGVVEKRKREVAATTTTTTATKRTQQKSVVKIKFEKNLDRKFFLEFFEVYRSLPALWNTQNPDYNNRTKKEIQYAQLLTKYRERYPSACHKDLTKRISILRSNFLKEYRRMEKAWEKAHYSDTVIETDCWFFDALRFIVEDVNDLQRPFVQTAKSKKKLRRSLREQKCSKSEQSVNKKTNNNSDSDAGSIYDESDDEEDDDNYSYKEENDEHENNELDEEEQGDAYVDIDGVLDVDINEDVEGVDFEDYIPKKPRLLIKRYVPELETRQQSSSQKSHPPREDIGNSEQFSQRALEEVPIAMAPRHSNNPGDAQQIEAKPLCHSTAAPAVNKPKLRNEYQSISDIWALKLQRMPRSQQLLAEKFISDILFEGQLGNLTRNSVQIKELPGVEEVFRTYNQNQNNQANTDRQYNNDQQTLAIEMYDDYSPETIDDEDDDDVKYAESYDGNH